jgi:Pregnancy-associated plasma protein-A
MSGVILRRVSLLAVIATAAVAAAFQVSPAGAASPQASWVCEPAAFNSLSTFSGIVSTARGGSSLREPDLGQTVESPSPQRGRGPAFSATVPTYVHVVSLPDGTGNVSDRAIRDEMRVLNAGFSGAEGGYNTGFSFTLAGITRNVNADWYYAGPTTSGEREMKRALHRGGDNALNVYYTTAGPYLGWAYLPSIVNQNGQSYLDGVVIDWESMLHTSTKYEGQYDLGKTLTHEVGHWVNLEHTFYGGCNHWGDYVEDTPPELTPTSGCPAGKDTCSEPGLDPIHNYMDYSYDSCYNQFTAGQTARAQDAWLYYRAP